ncbi:exostosin-1a-like [Dendronephthya gigantea]|uniref:exostosin-1a-like n=1 Tax=Dendronephthya gigantea TaxID=151771 RepID=UPI0010692257|nr:exostosin-1a-like [Dendronephthya gigantea]
MKAKIRLLLSFLVIVGTAITWFIIQWNFTKLPAKTFKKKDLIHSISEEDEYAESQPKQKTKPRDFATDCQMDNCFDFQKCINGFKVYVYPFGNGERISVNYAKIIRVIKKSAYYTDNPGNACLFVSSFDTTDQDKLSKDYVRELGYKISHLPYWNGGKNHILFNLYSGTWPDYREKLDIDIGQAILVKASFNAQHFRPNFDVSFPLFDKDQPMFGGGNLPYSDRVFPILKKYKLAFKGKRYLNGKGGESRSSLHHIHNNEDIIMLTTCKHGRNWKDMKDLRCDHDNELFDRYDYDELMGNATFCLIPRGRRLGSYRFLEALQSSCIPLILSNGWVLPFSDNIDWKKAAVFADERLLTLIPTIIREFTHEQIFQMKQQVLFLWNAYFSSIDKIVNTVFKIIQSRIDKQIANQYFVWNTFPGSLHIAQSYSRSVKDYPFYYQITGHEVASSFTAVIYATSSYLRVASPLYTLIQTVAKSQYLEKIVVLWTAKENIPSKRRWPSIDVTIAIQRPDNTNGNSRLSPRSLISSDVILSLDEDVTLNVDEINFAFQVWRKFPQRIVGFPCRSHYWDRGLSKWFYTSRWSNECSMVLTNAAFYHRYYHHYYTHNLPTSIHELISTSKECQDIVLNFITSHITRQPAIKVLERKPYKEDIANLYKKNSANKDHFTRLENRKACFEKLVDGFGYMPLVYTNVRFDPVLYKDPISNFRKKYRLLEA